MLEAKLCKKEGRFCKVYQKGDTMFKIVRDENRIRVCKYRTDIIQDSSMLVIEASLKPISWKSSVEIKWKPESCFELDTDILKI